MFCNTKIVKSLYIMNPNLLKFYSEEFTKKIIIHLSDKNA